MSGSKTAWPLYVTIGNLTQSCRASKKQNGLLLLGLLPSIPEKHTAHMTKQSWHSAVGRILLPLQDAERDGIDMVCADGWVRHCYPRLARWLADYPEQCLLTLTKQGRCPVCECPQKRMADLTGPAHRARSAVRYKQMVARREQLQGPSESRRPSDLSDTTDPEDFGVWWRGLRSFADDHECDIFEAIGPDRLHQLLKGVLKDHTWSWALIHLQGCEGEKQRVVDLIDDRFSQVPHFPGLRNFGGSFSKVRQWTGAEYKDLLKIWMGVLAPFFQGQPEHLKALRALTEFIMIVSYPSQSDETLGYLTTHLAQYEKGLGLWNAAREDFNNIPKIHMMRHYIESIREFGCISHTDTELSEGAHLEVKRAYEASNKVDFIPQMLSWHDRLFQFRTRVTLIKDIVRNNYPTADQCRHLIDNPVPERELVPARATNVADKRCELGELEDKMQVALSHNVLEYFTNQEDAPTQLSPTIEATLRCPSRLRKLRVRVAKSVRVTYRAWKHPEEIRTELVRCNPCWRGKAPRNDFILYNNRIHGGRRASLRSSR